MLSSQGLDANFADSGMATTAFTGPANSVSALATESDGKLVAVGMTKRTVYNPSSPDIPTIYAGYAIARYNADGSLDTTFGSGGKIETPLVKGGSGADDVAIQNDGKILVTGGLGLLRYNSDGSVDTSFGANGVVSGIAADWVKLQGDKIIVSSTSLGMRRLNLDGSLDSTFGNQGIISGAPFGQFVIDGQGRIIVVTGATTFARYTRDGSSDASFGNGGQITVPGAVNGYAQRVALAPDGKIVWAGAGFPGSDPQIATLIEVARFNSDGTLDTGFAFSGMTVINADKNTDAFALLVQADDKIAVAGRSGNAFFGHGLFFTGDIFTARLNADGTPDASWGNGGNAKIIDGIDGEAYSIAAEPNGQLAIAGTASGSFFVARFADSFNQSFVEHAYLNLLSRPADPSGLDYFTGLLVHNQISRTQFVTTIQASSEYRQLVVERAYHDYLHRAADAGGLQLWSNFLASGADEEQLSANIVGSDEYFNQISGGSETAFLDHLFMDVLKRPIDPAAAQWFTAALTHGEPRSQVADEVMRSPENNNLVVTTFYQTILGRTPDPAGLALFTNALAAQATWEQVAAALITSDEYFSGIL